MFWQGIEFDPVGKRRAYWLHTAHPGDAWGALQGGLGSRPVPASEIAHIYEKQRTQGCETSAPKPEAAFWKVSSSEVTKV
jgi:capsid protein